MDQIPHPSQARRGQELPHPEPQPGSSRLLLGKLWLRRKTPSFLSGGGNGASASTGKHWAARTWDTESFRTKWNPSAGGLGTGQKIGT